MQETDTQVLLKGMEFAYIFDKRTALPVQVTFAGKDYFTHPAELNIWRAPTDNDMYLKLEWKKAHYEEAYTRAYDMSVPTESLWRTDPSTCICCSSDGTKTP